jgi:hypothetical protein
VEGTERFSEEFRFIVSFPISRLGCLEVEEQDAKREIIRALVRIFL